MQTLPQYKNYKDVEMTWVKKIPEHWGIKRLKFCCVLNSLTLPEETHPDQRISYVDIGAVSQGRINRVEHYLFKEAPSRARRLVNPGDTIVSMVRTYLKAISYVRAEHANCVFSTGFCTLSPNDSFDKKFFSYVIQSDPFIGEIVRHSDGVSFPAVTPWTLGNFLLPIPSVGEQSRIAEFLDRKTADIDKAIVQKQRLIERLHERKTILTNQAVTQGLNPDAPMRDSSVKWLNQIPRHWRVKRLKYFSHIQGGVTLGKIYPGKNLVRYPYLRVANVQSGYFNLDQVTELALPQKEAARYAIQLGDILVTEGGDLDKLGRGAIWEGQIETCLHQNHIFAIRLNPEIAAQYFVSLVMTCDYGRQYFIDTAVKTTNLASTNRTKLGNFPVLLPPMHEQKKIMTYVKKIDADYSDAISVISNELKTIKELRQILIANTITGALKV